ncbi:hypothetical protein QA633_39610 [Bradyrhizobium barranii]|nr:hypothetical protein [Bradyrhizobium barranii]WFT94320.1 hypothetical protein QA633_39610 [Bradyrhizobium barranii]
MFSRDDESLENGGENSDRKGDLGQLLVSAIVADDVPCCYVELCLVQDVDVPNATVRRQYSASAARGALFLQESSQNVVWHVGCLRCRGGRYGHAGLAATIQEFR